MSCRHAIALITTVLCALARAIEESSFDSNNGSLSHETSLLESNVASNTTESSIVNLSFLSGFLSSLSMIVTSELLDKSFFIAVVMAMRHPRTIVYAGVIAALTLMTVLSATVGLLTAFIPRWITVYASAALMLIFGLKMFYDAYRMSAQQGLEDYGEVEKAVAGSTNRAGKGEHDRLIDDDDEDEPTAIRSSLKVFAETFTLTFLAEWGDRSQMATVLLAATEPVLGVVVGGVVGHAICTAAAVLGGRVIARYVSVRAVTILGGIVFLLFAVLSTILFSLNPTV